MRFYVTFNTGKTVLCLKAAYVSGALCLTMNDRATSLRKVYYFFRLDFKVKDAILLTRDKSRTPGNT